MMIKLLYFVICFIGT